MRTLRHSVYPVLIALSLLGTSCKGDDDDDDVYDVPDDDDIFVPGPGDEDWPCDFPEQCRADLGCSDGACVACRDATECQSLRGCDDGVCGACSDSAQCRLDETCRDGWCLPSEVPDWELTIDPADIALMDVDVYASVSVPATLVVGDVTYAEGVEVRYLGGSTRAFPKKSFRITFPENAEHPGFARRINLRAEYNDRSFVRNFIAYESARRLSGLTAPRTRYVNLTVNGENAGLMLEVERIGGRFLRVNGRDRDRSMYEGKEATEFGALVPLGDLTTYQEVYSKAAGLDDDWTDLVQLIEQDLWGDYLASEPWGPTTTSLTRQTLDVQSYVRYLALMGVIQNQDHVTNNFYLSWQPVHRLGDRWEFYPWDLDLSFGCLWDETENSALCSGDAFDGWWMDGILFEPMIAGPPNECWCNMAAHLVLWDPELIVRYEQTLCDNVASDWWNTQLPSLVGALAQTIETRVHADPMDQNLTPAEWDDARAAVLQFMHDRRDYLQDQLQCEYD